MVIRRMDTRGPRLLPRSRPGTQLHLRVWWECTDVEGEPFIQIPRADGQEGIRVGWGGCIHLGPAHITCMTDVRRCCTRTRRQAHSALPGSIRHSVMMGGHLLPGAAGACLAGEARKAMALFSCKKLKNLPSVQ